MFYGNFKKRKESSNPASLPELRARTQGIAQLFEILILFPACKAAIHPFAGQFCGAMLCAGHRR
ncbi:MAG: hypothetical protein RR825_09055, partial [Ruthenibacterium sp.]